MLDGPITARLTAPAAATPTSQPSRNDVPLDFAFGVISMSTMATMGIGLIATPTANGRS